MPKVLILCAHRPGRSPSQRYRFEQYLPFLEEKGFSFTWSYLLDEVDDGIFYGRERFLRKVWILKKSLLIRLRDLLRFRKFDILFIQREASFLGTSFFEKRAFLSGAHVIFDFDDAIWLADTSPGNLKWEWVKRPQKFFDNLKYAHRVIAGNTYLAERARPHNANVTVIPTTVDTAIHIPKPQLRGKSRLTIGWSGSISTVKHFDPLVPVLKKLKALYGPKIGFRLLGVSEHTCGLDDLETIAWSAANEVDELNRFDIGLMPLPDNEWTQGKCGLKGLTYMACGVPVVMSAVGVNKEIVQNGVNGFLASSAQDWLSVLSQLIEDPQLRERVSHYGRETVIAKYSVESNRERYLEVFRTGTRTELRS